MLGVPGDQICSLPVIRLVGQSYMTLGREQGMMV